MLYTSIISATLALFSYLTMIMLSIKLLTVYHYMTLGSLAALNALAGNTKGYHCTIDLLFGWFGLVCFANKNKNGQLSNSWFQTSQTGGQWYSDSSPFSIPWLWLIFPERSMTTKIDKIGPCRPRPRPSKVKETSSPGSTCLLVSDV